VADVIDRYLKENPELIKYEKSVLAWWRNAIGALKVNQLRKAHVLSARTELKKEPSRERGTVSVSTVNTLRPS
jgi:hypothetical protein